MTVDFYESFQSSGYHSIEFRAFLPLPHPVQSRWIAIKGPCISTAIHSALLKLRRLFESWWLQPVKRQRKVFGFGLFLFCTLYVLHSPPRFFIAGTYWPISGWIWASLSSLHLSLTQGEQHLLRVELCKWCGLYWTESASNSLMLRCN